MSVRLVVLGWDSATFDVADPLIDEGRLPVLADLIRRGHRAPLRSTWPPMTDCAWTSAFTGLNPGSHGIFGSWYRAPGSYEPRYFSSRDRRAPALWELAPEVRWLVWNVPMTFPPTTVNGAMVAGYGAPPGARYCEPAAMQDELHEKWAPDRLLDLAPHGSLEDFRSGLLDGLDAQAEAIPWAAERTDAECVVAVWPQIDRAQHFFWRFRDSDHPLAGTVDEVYEAMDRATGRLLDAFPDANFLVVSDHGAGPLKGDVNIGAWLAARGYARFGEPRSRPMIDMAWKLPAPVRRMGRRMAPGMANKAMGATLAGDLGAFDWSRTKAFLGFHSDLWLNLKGRETQGVVDEEEAGDLLDRLASALLELEDPSTGERVFRAVHRRDEIYHGEASGLAPDLMLDCWSQGYRVAPKRHESERDIVPPNPLAGVEESWSADHRPLGIFVAGGNDVQLGTSDELSLYDVCPTSLALLDQAIPDGLDGTVAQPAIDPGFLERHPVRTGSAAGPRSISGEYSEEEAASVAAHLKDLGYIE